MIVNAKLPYWRLSSFYFFYFAFLGAWVPFWNLFLEQELMFTAAQIGYLTAAMMLSKIIGPFVWGCLADYVGHRMPIIRWGSLAACICFMPIFTHQTFYFLLCSIFFYSFFWNAVLAQFEVVTLSHLKADSDRYAQIRLWGSIGFMVAVVGLGFLFDVMRLSYLPHLLMLLLLAIWLSSLVIQEPVAEIQTPSSLPDAQELSFLQQLGHKPVIIFLIISFLMQFSHGPYYTFFSIYLEQLQYTRPVIGGLWALGVVAEIILFMLMHHVLRLFRLKTLLMVTLILTVVRWFILAYWADVLWPLLFAQLLHAASFASFHSVSMAFLHGYFTPANRGQGQAIYSAFCYGVGGALGAVISGELWHYGAASLFLSAALAMLIGIVLLLFMGRQPLLSGEENKSREGV